MKSRQSILAIISLCLIIGLSAPLLGQADSISQSEKDSTWTDWNVRLSPYLWLLGIKGQIAITPDPAQLPEIPPPAENLPAGRKIYDIDLSFKDVRHSLKFAVMLSGQFEVKRFVTQFNVSSIVLESSGETAFDYFFQNNTIRLAYAGGDLGLGYRVVQNKKFTFDLLAGLKFVYTKVGLQTQIIGQHPIDVQTDKLWTDPVIATNLSYRPHKRIELAAYGDMGYTLFNDNLTYQFSTQANVFITKFFYMSVGYRQYYFDFSAREAFYAGSMQGMIFKIGFQF